MLLYVIEWAVESASMILGILALDLNDRQKFLQILGIGDKSEFALVTFAERTYFLRLVPLLNAFSAEDTGLTVTAKLRFFEKAN